MEQEDMKFIKDLIAGEPRTQRTEKAFLFDIVANKRNSVDVDKYAVYWAFDLLIPWCHSNRLMPLVEADFASPFYDTKIIFVTDLLNCTRRFDYIQRDCFNVGLKSSYDCSR